jgi:pimeloyl-ACP methyl ester carboxylesterase
MPELVEEYVDAPIGKIQLWRAGSGPTLVYLHSAGGEYTNPALEQLAESFEVIVPIFPGFAESEGLEEIDSMEDAVFHLLDLWGILGLGAPPILGVSLGGWLALELATRYPERVSKMVLVNPVGLHLDEAPIAEMFGRTPGELADMLFADQSYPVAAAMHDMDAFAGDVGRETEIPLEFVLPMWKALGATARLGWDPYLHNPKLRGRLRRITAPTLVVAGAADGLVPLVYAQTYAAEIPGARLEVIDRAAHWLQFEKPDELVALVRLFLAEDQSWRKSSPSI